MYKTVSIPEDPKKKINEFLNQQSFDVSQWDDPETRANAEKNIQEASAKISEIENKLSDLQQGRYQVLSNQKGIDQLKAKIYDADDAIAQAETGKNIAIDKVRANPYASASTITGQVARVQDFANADIATKIRIKDSYANQYNSELSDIYNQISREEKDLLNQYNFASNTRESNISVIQSIQKNIIELTKMDEESKRWASEFSLKVQQSEQDAELKYARLNLDAQKYEQDFLIDTEKLGLEQSKFADEVANNNRKYELDQNKFLLEQYKVELNNQQWQAEYGIKVANHNRANAELDLSRERLALDKNKLQIEALKNDILEDNGSYYKVDSNMEDILNSAFGTSSQQAPAKKNVLKDFGNTFAKSVGNWGKAISSLFR